MEPFLSKAWSKAVSRDGHFDGLVVSVRIKRKLGEEINQKGRLELQAKVSAR